MKVTIHDVAREAEVSISTVSYALTGKRPVSAKTKRKVAAAVKRLGYQPNAGARMLGGTRSNIFALLEPLRADSDARAHMSFMFHTVKISREQGYDVLLLTGDDDTQSLERVSGSGLADCFLVLDVAREDPRVDLLREQNTKAVVVGLPGNTSGLFCVDLDIEKASEMTVEKFSKSGHRRIALITQGEETLRWGANYCLRLIEGVTDAAEKRDIEVAVIPAKDDKTKFIADVAELLNSDSAPTGLILNCRSSQRAQIINYLEEENISVPKDLSVITVLNSVIETANDEPYDCIPFMPEQTCARAVEIAVELASGKSMTPRVELIEPTYIDQGSISGTQKV